MYNRIGLITSKLILFFVLIYASIQTTVASNLWPQLASDVVTQVKNKNYLAAKQALEKLEHKFVKQNFALLNLSLDAVNALADTLLDLDYSLTQIVPNEAKILANAVKMQLAFDATQKKKQPLWMQYASPLNNYLSRLKTAVNTNDKAKINIELTNTLELVSIIRPALVVTKDPILISQLDSVIAFLKQQPREEVTFKEAVENLGHFVKAILEPSASATNLVVSDQNSLGNIIICIGVIISFVALFVSWRNRTAN